MQQLTEKYRPRDWPEVIGQTAVCETLAGFEEDDTLAGRAYFIVGGSGRGKTTIARLIASKISNQWNTQEMDALDCNAEFIREASEVFMYAPMGCSSRCYIINESHGLWKENTRRLLKVTEAPFLSQSMTWVFTTTPAGQREFQDMQKDSGPLLSRCVRLELEDEKADLPMAKRLKQIAKAEKLDGKPLAAYKKLLEESDGNMREALQKIDAGAMVN